MQYFFFKLVIVIKAMDYYYVFMIGWGLVIECLIFVGLCKHKKNWLPEAKIPFYIITLFTLLDEQNKISFFYAVQYAELV